MNAKTWASIATVGMTLGVLPLATGAESTAERLERGVNLQETDGDLDAAIKEFEAVLRTDEKSKKLAAEARYRLAACYHAKGNGKLVRKHVEALRADFSAENRWVQKAAVLLPRKCEFAGSPWSDGRLYRAKVHLKNGRDIGHFIFAERKAPGHEGVWETFVVRTAGNDSLSRSLFNGESFLPIEGRWYIRSMGDITTEFQKGGMVRLINSETTEEMDSYDHSKSDEPSPLYENEQMIQLVRTLNQEIGTKQDTVLIAALNGALPIPFTMEVTEHLDIEVPAGRFPCAKIETNLKQTFYVSRDDQRRIVKLGMGVANVVLVEESEWNPATPTSLSSGNFGFTIDVPGAMFVMDPVDNDEVYRVKLWSSDFAGRDGMLEVNWTKNLQEEARASSRAFADVRIKGAAKNFDKFEVVEDSWEDLEVAGIKAVGCRIVIGQGELTEHEYAVLAVGEEKAISFHLNHAGPDAEAARERTLKLLSTMQWTE